LSGKTRICSDLLCVEWDVKPYTLTHSLVLMKVGHATFDGTVCRSDWSS